MTKLILSAALALLLVGCEGAAPPVECPDLSVVALASIGGGGFIDGLANRLAGSDRENTITEVIGEIHRRDPALGADAITNILVAADCPNAAANPDRSEAAVRARIAALRAQVDQLLVN